MNVRVENLSMRYDDAGRVVDVFNNLSFIVSSGESLAIIGQSGVGKTTLLYLLGLLEKPSSGKIFYNSSQIVGPGAEKTDKSRFRGTNIGFVFQSHYLLPEFTALENVAMPLIVQGLDFAESYGKAENLLSRMGLAERLTHRPTMLSGGEQQRVAIARALVARPGLVLADEPTGNLDANTASSVQELLFELQREMKLTLIVVTHSKVLAHSLGRVFELTQNGLVNER